MHTPDSKEWITEVMSRSTLTCVTDGSYIRQLTPDISGAGWIIQDRRTGMKVKGLLAEWPRSASSYRGEMLGMLAVWVFLLAVEDYFHKSGMVGEGNKVSCDNKGALTMFEKSARGYQRPQKLTQKIVWQDSLPFC